MNNWRERIDPLGLPVIATAHRILAVPETGPVIGIHMYKLIIQMEGLLDEAYAPDISSGPFSPQRDIFKLSVRPGDITQLDGDTLVGVLSFGTLEEVQNSIDLTVEQPTPGLTWYIVRKK